MIDRIDPAEQFSLILNRKQRRYAEAPISASLIVWRDKRSEGRCRMCQRSEEVRPLTRHHVVPLAFFTKLRGRKFSDYRNGAPCPSARRDA